MATRLRFTPFPVLGNSFGVEAKCPRNRSVAAARRAVQDAEILFVHTDYRKRMNVQISREVCKTGRIQPRKKVVKSHLLYPICSLLGLLLSGCGSSEVGEVYGTVTLDGEPLANAVIEFTPTGGEGRSSFGRTDEEGNYDLEFARDRNGAWIGENQVLITTAEILEEGDENGEDRYSPERVPEKYSHEVRNVESGSNRFDFFLTSDGR